MQEVLQRKGGKKKSVARTQHRFIKGEPLKQRSKL